LVRNVGHNTDAYCLLRDTFFTCLCDRPDG